MERRIMVMAAWIGALLVVPLFGALAQTAPLSLTVSNNGVKTLRWPLVPGLDTLEFKAGQSLDGLSTVPSATISRTPSGYVYSTSNQAPSGFYSLRLGQMSPEALASANLLNRIAYGP